MSWLDNYFKAATSVTLAGDVAGPSGANTIAHLLSRAVSGSAAEGQALGVSGGVWTGITAGGGATSRILNIGDSLTTSGDSYNTADIDTMMSAYAAITGPKNIRLAGTFTMTGGMSGTDTYDTEGEPVLGDGLYSTIVASGGTFLNCPGASRVVVNSTSALPVFDPFAVGGYRFFTLEVGVFVPSTAPIITADGILEVFLYDEAEVINGGYEAIDWGNYQGAIYALAGSTIGANSLRNGSLALKRKMPALRSTSVDLTPASKVLIDRLDRKYAAPKKGKRGLVYIPGGALSLQVQVGDAACSVSATQTNVTGLALSGYVADQAAGIAGPRTLGYNPLQACPGDSPKLGGIHVDALADSAITLSGGAQTADDYSCTAGKIVHCICQADPITNGPWTVTASGPYTRPSWFAAASSASGVMVAVQNGTWYGGESWLCTNPAGTDVVGTHPLFWSGSVTSRCFPVDDDTLYFWPCQEESGATLYDLGPSTANVTLTGTEGVNYRRVQLPNRKQFAIENIDGSPIAVVSGLTMPVGDLTIDCNVWWNQIPPAQVMTVFYAGSNVTPGNDDGFSAYYDGAGDSYMKGGSCKSSGWTNFAFGVRLQTSIPGHCAIVWHDGAGADLWINGIKIGTQSRAVSLAVLTYLTIGCDSRASSSLHGVVSNLRVSAVARPDAWIKKRYLQGART